MASEIGFITFDCADAEVMIDFWSDLLGYEIRRGVYTTLRDPAGQKPTIYMQEVPEPRTAKNRVHVDLVTKDRVAETLRIESLGGKVLQEVSENDTDWTVFQDPEGNEFCLFQD